MSENAEYPVKGKTVETGIDGWRGVPHGGLGSITGFSLKPVPKSGAGFRWKSGSRETARLEAEIWPLE
jgi:hypothetical protein